MTRRRRSSGDLASPAPPSSFGPRWSRSGLVSNIAGQPVELVVSSIGAHIVRVSLIPAGGSGELNDDGALVPLASKRLPSAGDVHLRGTLSVSIESTPVRIRLRDASHSSRAGAPCRFRYGARSTSRSATRRSWDSVKADDQFDRRGSQDAMRNGQGGYQLRTHGGRVPIQWLIGTSGWGLFIHRPLGTFDLAGPRGRLTAATPLPLDVFVVALDGSRRHHAGVRAHHRAARDAAALVVRLSAIASHARRSRRDPVGRAHDAREEAAVRRADLPRHRLHAVGMEHAQRRVHLEPEELPGSRGADRRSCTTCTTRWSSTRSSRGNT